MDLKEFEEKLTPVTSTIKPRLTLEQILEKVNMRFQVTGIGNNSIYFEPIELPTDVDINNLVAIFKRKGYNSYVGGNGKLIISNH